MKTILILFLAVSSLFAQRKKQTTEYLTISDYKINDVVQKPFKVGYLAYTPDSYYLNPCVSYPLILSFHGNGQKGTMTPDILRGSFVPRRLDQGLNVEAVVISPQTNGWKPKWGEKSWYKNLLDTIIAKYRIDTTQIYVMGYSGGGEGVSVFVKNYPCQGIATFAPVITLSTTDKCLLVGKKVWGFHCVNDATIRVTSTQNLIKDIVKCPLYQYSNSTPRASYYPSGGHDGSWQNGLKTDSVFKHFLTK